MAAKKVGDLMDEVKAEMRESDEEVAKSKLRLRLRELRASRKAHAAMEKQVAELLEESVFDDEEDVDDGATA